MHLNHTFNLEHFTMSYFKQIYIIIAGIFISQLAHADAIGLHLVTWHSSKGHNSNNWGIIYQRNIEGYDAVAGAYCNSESRSRRWPTKKECQVSAYGGVDYTLWKNDHFKTGVVVGIITGYTDPPLIPFAAPKAAVDIWGYEVAAVYQPKAHANGAHAINLLLIKPF